MSDIVMIAIAAGIGILIGIGSCLARVRGRRAAELEARLKADEELAGKLTKRIRPDRPFANEWTCQSVREARDKAWRKTSNGNRAVALCRKLAPGDLTLAETMERDASACLRSAEAVLDYCEADVVALIGRMRQAVEGVHAQAVQLRRAAVERLDELAARGRPHPEEAERLRMLATALEAHRPMIATAPVTTLRALNAQLGVIRDVLAALEAEPAGDAVRN